MAPLLQMTRAVPIVFVQVVDPVGSGFVASLARPGGNVTGFTNFECAIGSKWLELLKEIAPGVTRVAPRVQSGHGAVRPACSGNRSRRSSVAWTVEPIQVPVRDAAEIERAIETLARDAERRPDGPAGHARRPTHRDLIIALAAAAPTARDLPLSRISPRAAA